LICWIALSVLTLFTAAYLAFLNNRQAAKRVRLGKVGKIVDASLEEYRRHGEGEAANEKAFDDLTDTKNEDFIYVL
jgi:hypothetical protein